MFFCAEGSRGTRNRGDKSWGQPELTKGQELPAENSNRTSVLSRAKASIKGLQILELAVCEPRNFVPKIFKNVGSSSKRPPSNQAVSTHKP